MTLNASTGDATFGGNGVDGDMRVKNAVDGRHRPLLSRS